jgi:hypothetical protein
VDCVFRFISNTTFRLKKIEILHRLQRLLVYKLFDSHYAPMLLFLNLSFSQLITVYSICVLHCHVCIIYYMCITLPCLYHLLYVYYIAMFVSSIIHVLHCHVCIIYYMCITLPCIDDTNMAM